MNSSEDLSLELASPLPHRAETSSPDDADQPSGDRFDELKAMGSAYEVLSHLDRESVQRAYWWLGEALRLSPEAPAQLTGVPAQATSAAIPATATRLAAIDSGQEEAPLPRIFMSQKKPNTIQEKIACLAYYLTYHRGMQHFKTADIVALNTEAASAKFANPSRDVAKTEDRCGYIVAAGNGMKQLTTRGEFFVLALPDREAANVALGEHPHRPKSPRNGTKRASSQAKDES
ncbi:hypothetical protein [Actinosynnema mirum]|uniref:Uncharacterized protein n=1 Tax=Actinosynnema mirum (strain ATCC 29888 / DSM 43827 / JCM 3225 / NBRC 14064 / NCIMB 13271 / NRRL B-12336 / IMRU 3971 / 101) TaxID=446462 RepID=C6WN51_ACTMD|nr:hypothetical protein [Actinosynnema mirum]ACU38564.1 hypothetical protein Amir_4734 [Actinosynnema mirum DSM 43827]